VEFFIGSAMILRWIRELVIIDQMQTTTKLNRSWADEGRDRTNMSSC